jgi:hypothetical protein
MNGMAIPDNHKLPGNQAQDLLEKGNHLVSSQVMPVGSDAQTNSFATGRYQQHAQEIDMLVVFHAGTLNRRLTTARPRPFERRDPSEAASIFKTQGSAQLATLFLSSAMPLLSTARSPRRCAAGLGAEGAGCSSPYAASHAKRRSDGGAL